MAAEDLPLQDRAEPVAPQVVDYDFATTDGLPMDFQWLRSPQPERLFSLTDNPGRLTLFGRESNWQLVRAGAGRTAQDGVPL